MEEHAITETYAINRMMDRLSELTLKHGLVCCGVREFGPTENAASGMELLTGLGGWTFFFCAADDKALRRRRCESYLFFDDGIEVDGNWDRMIETVYRRLMETQEMKAAQRTVIEFPDVPDAN